MPSDRYHSWVPLLSRPGLLYIAEGDRDVGKSYPMLLRAMRRMVRNHRATVWLRRTEDEAKTWLSSVGNDKWKKVAKQARIDPERIRRQGRRVMYNKGDAKNPEWVEMIRAGAVSEWSDFRDTDDPVEEFIYLDEAFATPEKYRRYNGNEVEHALDIFKSLRRGESSDMRMLIAGNAENAVNPWFEYFGVPEPSIESGFLLLRPRHHQEGFPLIPYERVRKGDVDAFGRLVSGTGYGAFLAGDPKGARRDLLERIPSRATLYASVDFGRRLSMWIHRDTVYVSLRHADGMCLRAVPNGDPHSIILTPQVRARFKVLRKAWQHGRIKFDSLQAVEWGMQAVAKIV